MIRATVHAHREVTPGRWYRTFIGAFEGELSIDSVHTLINFARTASNHDAVALLGTFEMTRRVAALFSGCPEALTLPLIVDNGILRSELRAVVNDPALMVPDSVQHQWTQMEINTRKPTARAGELPV